MRRRKTDELDAAGRSPIGERPAAVARYAPDFALDPWRFVRILLVGFDTLHFTAPVGLTDSQAWTFEKQAQSTREGEQILYELDGEPFVLHPSGGASYRFRLEAASGTILLGKRADDQRKHGELKVEIGSWGCWNGPPRAVSDLDPCVATYQHMRRACNELLRLGDGWPARPARADFCVDYAGGPELDQHAPLGVVTRAKRAARQHTGRRVMGPLAECKNCGERIPIEFDRARFCAFCSWDRTKPPHPDPSKRPEAKWVGDYVELDGRQFFKFRKFTGWQWGMGVSCMLRWYNKSEEIKQQSPDKVWFKDKWIQRGNYRDGDTVLRVESEDKRPMLQSFKVDGERLETMEKLFEHAQSCWRYTTGHYRRICYRCWQPGKNERARRCERCAHVDRHGVMKYPKLYEQRGWWSLRIRSREKVCRWKTHPLQKILQDVKFDMSNEANPRLQRVRDQALAALLLPNGVGQLTSWASALGVRGALYQKLGRAPTADELTDEFLYQVKIAFGSERIQQAIMDKDAARVAPDDDSFVMPKNERTNDGTREQRVDWRARELARVTSDELDASRVRGKLDHLVRGVGVAELAERNRKAGEREGLRHAAGELQGQVGAAGDDAGGARPAEEDDGARTP